MKRAWEQFSGKQTGDTILLIRKHPKDGASLVEGTVGRMTPATRRFLTPSGREGYVQVRKGTWRELREDVHENVFNADGKYIGRSVYRVATQDEIDDLRDPLRPLREDVRSKVGDLRWGISPRDFDPDGLVSKLEAALTAARALAAAAKEQRDA